MSHPAARMFLLQYGAERVPKALSLRGGPAHLYWEPLLGVLVETTEGWILYDTGMARDALDSEEAQAIYRDGAAAMGIDVREPTPALYPEPPDHERWNWGLPGDPLAAALGEVGLKPSDLTLAVISHLHLDHSGGIPLLARAGVPVAIQRAELDFVRGGGASFAEGFREADWSAADTRWHLLDGDAELAPGVRVMSTPGHTPGHSSLAVELPGSGTWIFAGDAADLTQNLLDRVPCGSCAGGTPEDERQARTSFDRLLREAAERTARLIPGHDQAMFNAVRHPRGGHR